MFKPYAQDQQASLKKAEDTIEEYLSGTQAVDPVSEEGEFDSVTTLRKETALAVSLTEGCRTDPGILQMERAGAVVLRCQLDPSISHDTAASNIKRYYDEIFPAVSKFKEVGKADSIHAVGDTFHNDTTYPCSMDAPQGSNTAGRCDFEHLNEELLTLDENITHEMKCRNSKVSISAT